MPFAACNGVNLYCEVHVTGEPLYLIECGRHGYFIEFREGASGMILKFLQRHRLG